MKRGTFTNQLPEYLALDMKAGTAEEHPLLAALDEIVSGWGSLAHRSGLSLDPSAFSQTQKRFTLEEMGFKVACLSPQQLDRLYYQMHQVLHLKPSLRAIELLAEIYFGSCRVRRGLPYRRYFLNASLRLPFALSSGEDTDTVVFVETHGSNRADNFIDGTLIDEFIANARLCLPSRYSVTVAPQAVKREKQSSAIRLVGQIGVQQRRL